MSKVDLLDGVYQLWLQLEDTYRSAVLFPTYEVEPALIDIPLTNLMRWVLLPTIFLVCTETVADMANQEICLTTHP